MKTQHTLKLIFGFIFIIFGLLYLTDCSKTKKDNKPEASISTGLPVGEGEITYFAVMQPNKVLSEGTMEKNTITLKVNGSTNDYQTVKPVIKFTGTKLTPDENTEQNFNQDVIYKLTTSTGGIKNYVVKTYITPFPEIPSITEFKITQPNGYVVEGEIKELSNTKGEITLTLFGKEDDYKNIKPNVNHNGKSINHNQEQDFTQGSIDYIVESYQGNKKTYTVTTTIEDFAKIDAFNLPHPTPTLTNPDGDIDNNKNKIILDVEGATTYYSNLAPEVVYTQGYTLTPLADEPQDFNRTDLTYTIKGKEKGNFRTYQIITNITTSTPIIPKISEFKIKQVNEYEVEGEIQNDPQDPSKGTINLTLFNNNGADYLQIEPIITHNGESITPTGPQNFKNGESLEYIVTSQTGHKKTYTVTTTIEDFAKIDAFNLPHPTPTLTNPDGDIDNNQNKITLDVEGATTYYSNLAPEVVYTQGYTLTPLADEPRDFNRTDLTYTIKGKEKGNFRTYQIITNITTPTPIIPKISEFKIIQGNDYEVEGIISHDPQDQSKGTINLTFFNNRRLDYTTTPMIQHDGVLITPAGRQTFSNNQTLTYTVTSKTGHQSIYTVQIMINKLAEIDRFDLKNESGSFDIGLIDRDNNNNNTIEIRAYNPTTTHYDNIEPIVEHNENYTLTPLADQKRNFNQPQIYTIQGKEKGNFRTYHVTTKITIQTVLIPTISEFSITQTNGYVSKGKIVNTSDPQDNTKGKITLTLFNNNGAPLTIEPFIKHNGVSITPTGSQNFENGEKLIYEVTSSTGHKKNYEVAVSIQNFVVINQFGLPNPKTQANQPGLIDDDKNTITLNVAGLKSKYENLAPIVRQPPNSTLTPLASQQQNFTEEQTYKIQGLLEGNFRTYKVTTHIEENTEKICKINSVEDLINISKDPDLSKNVNITCNLEQELDLNYQAIEPIQFIGTFNGGGRIIRNFKSDKGFFAVNPKKIENLKFVEARVENTPNASKGVLIEQMSQNSEIEINNVHFQDVQLFLTQGREGGGGGIFLNFNSDSKVIIKNSSVQRGTLDTRANSGGFIGQSIRGTIEIENSYFEGQISVNQYTIASAGGLIGSSRGEDNIKIKNSYTNVQLNMPTITNSNSNYLGGLIGSYHTPTKKIEIENSYAAGTIQPTESSQTGGLIGYNTPFQAHRIISSYHNEQMNVVKDVGTPLKPAEIKKTDFIRWDFDSIWNWNGDGKWPTLRNNPNNP